MGKAGSIVVGALGAHGMQVGVSWLTQAFARACGIRATGRLPKTAARF
jgi:hypothetical protein